MSEFTKDFEPYDIEDLKVEKSKSSLGKYVVKIANGIFRFHDDPAILEKWINAQKQC